MTGRGPRRRRKMGYEGSAAQWGGRRKEVADRMSVGGVEFTHGQLNGWACSMCGQLIALAGMIGHAKGHAADVRLAAALPRVTAAMVPLGPDQLAEVEAFIGRLAGGEGT